MRTTRLLVLSGLILAAATARLVPHPDNFSPVMAMALLAGACFVEKRWAFVVPLSAFFLSDLFLGFHRLMPLVYGSAALVVCLGFWLRTRRSVLPITCAALAGALLFFFITNFGVWALGTIYPKTLEGLWTCYLAGIPYFRNTLLGDASYTALLFGGWALAERLVPALRPSQTESPVRVQADLG